MATLDLTLLYYAKGYEQGYEQGKMAERERGEWQITESYPHNVYCSVCHKRYAQTHWDVWNDAEMPLPRNFCPNCGADMRKNTWRKEEDK